ncbi:MAG: nucleotidyltransferase domain-containing protein [Mycoplasmataceae bacterium]|nr:nucleotidyltransferase domain-containing protein [Mycoplasmataceae bacterium]
MNNKINASELQRKGIKDIYKMLDKHPYFVIENQRENKELYITKRKDNLGEIIQVIRLHEKELKEAGIISVSVFGSCAKGTATDKSDVDLLLEVNKDVDLLDFAKMKKFIIKELNIDKLDIHNKRFIKKQILDSALKEQIHAF